MKNRIILFLLTGICGLSLVSCLSGDEYDYTQLTDCQISAFTLTNDSVPGLNDVRFTIDQINGYIYNIDSMPVGTEIKNVLCQVSVNAGAGSIEISPEALGDTTYYWNSTDSIDFSKPVRFTVNSAYNNSSSKSYLAWVNIHTIVPDFMQWNQVTQEMLGESSLEQKVIPYTYNDEKVYFQYIKNSSNQFELYYSTADDLQYWEELPLTGLSDININLYQLTACGDYLYLPNRNGGVLRSENGLDWEAYSTPEMPNIVGIFGMVNSSATQPDIMLSALALSNGIYSFAAMDTSGQWILGEEVPESFPINDFASANYENVNHAYLNIAGGTSAAKLLQNSCWTTTDGYSWVQLSSENGMNFSSREGAMLAFYDNKLMLIGGIDSNGRALKDIYLSTDRGLTWAVSDTMVVMPENFAARGYSSICMDDEKYILLFGGKTSSSARTMDDIWKGRINRLGFDEE